jgi:hypothetical protein
MQRNVNDTVEGMTVIMTTLGMARKMERISTEKNISALVDICADGMTETPITIKGDTVIARSTR